MPYFRLYTNDDVVGVELAGALKNVVAIAAGILDGLGMGHNARAALITRGLAEISRLGVAMGARPATFAGLAGMGDLLLTATGPLSRNRSLGVEVGRGRALDDVVGRRALGGRGGGDGAGRGGPGGQGRRGAADRPGSGVRAVRGQAAPRGDRAADGAQPEERDVELTVAEPVQEFFSIGEVCSLTDLKPHVLRYWESQFRFLNPAKNRSGNRVYQRREIELIMLVKHLLYTEKYTIEGARQRIEQYRRTGELKPEARQALALETVRDLRAQLQGILKILNGDRASDRE